MSYIACITWRVFRTILLCFVASGWGEEKDFFNGNIVSSVFPGVAVLLHESSSCRFFRGKCKMHNLIVQLNESVSKMISGLIHRRAYILSTHSAWLDKSIPFFSRCSGAVYYKWFSLRTFFQYKIQELGLERARFRRIIEKGIPYSIRRLYKIDPRSL